MSYNYDTYVGPYARCAVERVPVTRMMITCPNEQCKNHAKGLRQPFCQLCGAKVASMSHIEMDFAINQMDVGEEIEEVLCDPGGDEYSRWSDANGAHLWMPNRKMSGRDPRLEERAPFAFFEIAEGQREAEIEVFRETFGDALDALRARYGNITLHWGIIQDYS